MVSCSYNGFLTSLSPIGPLYLAQGPLQKTCLPSQDSSGILVLYFSDHLRSTRLKMGFSGGSDGKESACNAGDPDSIPRSGRSPGEGDGYLLQYSCLGNSMDRGAWRTTVHGVTESQTCSQAQDTFSVISGDSPCCTTPLRRLCA